MIRRSIVLLILSSLLILSGSIIQAQNTTTYAVTITNLTEGQPFTPPLIAVHRPAVELFQVGQPANVGIQQIAENGNLDPAVDFVSNSRHVLDFTVAVGDIPPLLPNQSITVTVESSRGANLLSIASMLICTNDGFTGVDSVRLPQQVGDSITVYSSAYDAGTEINTEDLADIVPPCQGLVGVSDDNGQPGTGMSNPALVENGVITHHPGIAGSSDLVPSIHGWTNPVMSVEIERID